MKATEDRVMTLHPTGKKGVRIERTKYENMRHALLKVIPDRGDGVPFRELAARVEAHLDATVFSPEVSRSWYVTTVKQDLEARGLVEQVRRMKPQHLRRTSTEPL